MTVRKTGVNNIKNIRCLSDDQLIRHYRTPPGNHLYAYQEDEHHVVVYRGETNNWEKKVPACRNRVVPNEMLWTIPSNWDLMVKLDRDSISYGLFYIPNTRTWVKLSIPTNNHLCDAQYTVKNIGKLDVKSVGDLGKSYEVRKLAQVKEEQEEQEELADLLLDIADSWDGVELALSDSIEWIKDTGIWENADDTTLNLSDDWIWTFQREIFRPQAELERCIDTEEYDISIYTAVRELREANLLPSSYDFKLTLDDSEFGMEYYIRSLIERGASPAEALDYYTVRIDGLTQVDWAKERGVDQSTVSENVSNAESVICS